MEAFKRCKGSLGRAQSVLTDSGYTGEPFAQGVREILGQQVTVQVAKRSELHTFKVIPKRWVVERSLGWLARFRSLSRDYERLPEVLSGLHFLVFAVLMLPAAARVLAAAGSS